MSEQITQIFDNKEEDGFGTVTVVTIDEDGMQYASTEAYYPGYSKEDAIARATQNALNK